SSTSPGSVAGRKPRPCRTPYGLSAPKSRIPITGHPSIWSETPENCRFPTNKIPIHEVDGIFPPFFSDLLVGTRSIDATPEYRGFDWMRRRTADPGRQASGGTTHFQLRVVFCGSFRMVSTAGFDESVDSRECAGACNPKMLCHLRHPEAGFKA